MLKYESTAIVLREIPDEVTLAINISNCPCNCSGCHSPYLAEDIGKPLIEYPKGYSDNFTIYIDELLDNNKGITCVCLMGGDSDPFLINVLASFIKSEYPNLKVGWYSGRQKLHDSIFINYFDYIKLGPYIEELGPLDSKTTNQRMYQVINKDKSPELLDITYKFWEKS